VRQRTFVGRTGELARLRSAAITAGSGGLILSGVAGVGKSRLPAEAVAELELLDPAESRDLLATMLGAPVEARSAQRLTRVRCRNRLGP
jgi:hypothetical protein